jgi:WD40 repeat protein
VKEGDVESIAFSPDGKVLAAGFKVFGNRGGGVALWDFATRQRREDLFPLKDGAAISIAFHASGRTLAAGYGANGRGGVWVWDVDLVSWQRVAGQVSNRNFTQDEWRQYFGNEPYRATFPELPALGGATER